MAIQTPADIIRTKALAVLTGVSAWCASKARVDINTHGDDLEDDLAWLTNRLADAAGALRNEAAECREEGRSLHYQTEAGVMDEAAQLLDALSHEADRALDLIYAAPSAPVAEAA